MSDNRMVYANGDWIIDARTDTLIAACINNGQAAAAAYLLNQQYRALQAEIAALREELSRRDKREEEL